jgi:hypothetical protein
MTNNLQQLVELARRAPRISDENPPPFFAQRVTANWLARSRQRETNLWERFALRGAAISLAAVVVALASSTLIPDYADEPETNDAAEIFSLP